MFDALENGSGLEFVLWLQSLRIPFLNILLQILNFMGHELAYIGIVAFIFLLVNRNLGMRLVFILLLANFTNALAKDLIATERPYEVSAQVEELVQEDSYGIPSGHVMLSLAVWGYLAYVLRRKWVWALVLVYVILQSLSRMMLGVHYPQDVIGGWLFGGGVLLLYIALENKVVAFWKSAPNPMRLAVLVGSVVVIAGCAYALSLKAPITLDFAENPCPAGAVADGAACLKAPLLESYFTTLGLLIGAAGAVWFSQDFAAAPELWRKIVLFLAGLGLAVGLLLLLGKVFDAISETGALAYTLRTIRYTLVSFFALGIWPLLALRFGFAQKMLNAGDAGLPLENAQRAA